jgi:hypothetical protein
VPYTDIYEDVYSDDSSGDIQSFLPGLKVTDSLVLGGVIELLAGGSMSVHPQCYGAYFRLGTGYDLSAPQMTSEQTASLLLDGEIVTGTRASNRTPTIPVVMYVPSSGDPEADRATLAGARELLLQTCAQPSWQLTWTRDGALPLIFDCQSLASTVISYSIRTEEALFSQVSVTFQAFPYGRSDVQEIVLFDSPAQQFPTPPSPVTIDDFGLTIGATNFLTGDNANFDGGTFGSWVSNGNCALAWVSTPTQAGGGAARMTSTAAGSMQLGSQAAANYTSMLPVNQGDTVVASAYFRAATTGRSVNVGLDFYDVNGNLVGSTLRGSFVTDTTSGFVQATASVTAPAGAAWSRVSPQVVSAGAGGEQHYVDTVVQNRGAVYSSNDSYQWGKQSIAAFGSWSAYWSRKADDYPVYDHVMPAALNITGLTKLGFWLGLSTSAQQWQVWHRGTVHFAITLYDAAGDSLSFGAKRTCHASALETGPHWQYVSIDVPQPASGFDFTTISRYAISAWNWFKPVINPDTGFVGQQVLQASAYINLVQALATTSGTPGTRGGWYILPGAKGTARGPLGIQAAPGPSGFSSTALFTTTGSNNWTCPAGVTHVDKAETWAAGGGGGGAQPSLGAGGGGGGEYAMELNVPVTPSTVYHPNVGAGGAAGSGGGSLGGTGGDSFFAGDSGRTVYAHGGKGGWQSSSWGGGKGGEGSSNYAHYSGGNGYQANANGKDIGGGGGSSAGSTGAGNDSTGRSGATAPYAGGPGGDGGQSGPNTSALSRGFAPTRTPGGGGGGGSDDGSGYAGAAGDNGQVLLTYGATGILPLQSLLVHQPAIDAPDTFNPLCPVGNGADTPNGSTEYQIPDIGNLNSRYDGTYTMYLVASAWNSPTVSRNLTVQLRQYPYVGGTATTLNVVRSSITPSTDLLGTQLIVDMGPVTLPLMDLPPGSNNGYFALTVTSSNTSDRFLDVLLIDTAGAFVLLNVGSSSILNNIWIDQPDATRDLGRLLGSNADRDQSFSILQYAERFSGGPFAVVPDSNNRVFVYSAQGTPAVTAYYPPQWWTERLE